MLCSCILVPSTPSDGDSSRPDEDKFGVSFLLNDVDETAAKDVAPGLSRELLYVLRQIKLLFILSKDHSRGLYFVLTCSTEAKRQQHQMLQPFLKVVGLDTNDVDDGNTVPQWQCCL